MGVMDDYIENRNRGWVNKEFLQATAAEVEYIVNQSGTDTDTTKYLNKGSDGGGFVLRPSDNVQITSIKNGGTELIVGDPITVTSAGFTAMRRISRLTSIKIQTLNANTMIKLLVV